MKATIMSPDLQVFASFRAAEMQPPPEPPVKIASCFAEPPGPHETFLVVHLINVVEDFHVHGAGKKIFADAFDHVGESFTGLAGFEFIVIEGADRIDAHDFYRGILFLQIFPYAGDCSASAHAADEMRNFPFGILPDFWACGPVVRLGIHRIFVLIWIKRIRNLAGEFGGNGIITSWIFGLDRGGADDNLGAESLQQVNFFARLLVGDGENDFVAAHAGHQRQSHPSISGSAFDNRPAGLEFPGTFSLIDHEQADAVFHRPPGVQIVGLDPHFRGKILGQLIEANNGRVAHRFENVIALHGGEFAPARAAIFWTTKSREIGKMRQA